MLCLVGRVPGSRAVLSVCSSVGKDGCACCLMLRTSGAGSRCRNGATRIPHPLTSECGGDRSGRGSIMPNIQLLFKPPNWRKLGCQPRCP
jgi:hypothetical protein